MAAAKLGFKAILIATLIAMVGLPAMGQTRTPLAKKSVRGRPNPIPKAKAVAKDPIGADAITLKDGKTLLGQVYDPSPRGGLIVIVRRAWAETHLPEWAAKWAKLERDANAGADTQRLERLTAWRRDRVATPGTEDRITRWLDRVLARPAGMAEPSVLMAARLTRGEVKTLQRRGTIAARTLRLGWTLGLNDVETMPLDELKDVLEGRGLLATGTTPIALDTLLPLSLESESQWLLRRAATEVNNDDGLRFIRFGNSVMPEPAPGRQADPGNAASLLNSTLQDLLGGEQADPLPPRLNEVAAKGKVGAMVTRLELASDMASVTVESTLYVRNSQGAWTRGPSRSGTVRTDQAATPGEVQEVADDPQVKSAFNLVDSLGFGLVSDDMKRKSLAIGATTKRALSLVRSALARDLGDLALPLNPPSTKAAAAKQP